MVTRGCPHHCGFCYKDAFFEGARRYFAAHAFGNTTLEDLLVQLEDVSGRDVRAWSRAWLETTGVSTLWLDTVPSDQNYTRPWTRVDSPFFAANDFYEIETSRRIDLFGNIAHVWSGYEARAAPGDSTGSAMACRYDRWISWAPSPRSARRLAFLSALRSRWVAETMRTFTRHSSPGGPN